MTRTLLTVAGAGTTTGGARLLASNSFCWGKSYGTAAEYGTAAAYGLAVAYGCCPFALLTPMGMCACGGWGVNWPGASAAGIFRCLEPCLTRAGEGGTTLVPCA